MRTKLLLLFGRLLLCLVFLVALASLSGCPQSSPSENVSSDGSPPDQPTVPDYPVVGCAQDAVCIVASNPDLRSCSLLLEQKDGDTPTTIDFHDGLRGRSKQQNKQLGLVFLWRNNEALNDQKPLVILHASSKEMAQKWSWQIVKQTCYDAKGQPIEEQAITLSAK